MVTGSRNGFSSMACFPREAFAGAGGGNDQKLSLALTSVQEGTAGLLQWSNFSLCDGGWGT